MTYPSFFLDPLAYSRVKIGGRLIKAVLREVDGTKVEEEWSEQRATGTNGATWVFKGTKPVGPHELTFECVNAEEEADLREVYEMMAPKRTALGGAATKDAFTIGPVKNADAGGVIPSTPASSKTTDDGGFPKNTTPSPGPKPPTFSIENAFVNYHGTTAVSRGGWEGPIPTETRSIKFKVKLVAQKAPTPAGTGVAAAKVGDQYAIGSGSKDGGAAPAGGSGAADAKAAQAGAAT